MVFSFVHDYNFYEMNNKLDIFISLANLFKSHGFDLFLVGGSVRDYLLNKDLTDMDITSKATPEEVLSFIDADDTFKRFGSLKINYLGVKFDYTTFRKEEGYEDYRHPNKIIFAKKLEDDVIRRDLTINALYLDIDKNVIDLVDGVKDIKNKTIRLIGNPIKRIKEDPLRIIRILRFKYELDFVIDENTFKAIKDNITLLNNLNVDKINQEIKKSSHQDSIIQEIERLKNK